MTNTRDWRRNREMWIKVLEKQTGAGLATWRRRIRQNPFANEGEMKEWLSMHGVSGYAEQLLLMERFGYPDFVLATAGELIDRQYADRPGLRAIYEAIVRAAEDCGEVIVQARKSYVSLVSPRRTFARVVPATKMRVDLGLRLDGQRPTGRLQPSKIHETMRVQIGLSSPAEVDSEVRHWLRRAYAQNT